MSLVFWMLKGLNFVFDVLRLILLMSLLSDVVSILGLVLVLVGMFFLDVVFIKIFGFLMVCLCGLMM